MPGNQIRTHPDCWQIKGPIPDHDCHGSACLTTGAERLIRGYSPGLPAAVIDWPDGGNGCEIVKFNSDQAYSAANLHKARNSLASTNLKKTIRLQREMLTGLLNEAMHDLARRCAEFIDSRIALENLLTNAFPVFSYCKHLYVLNADGIQITDNITREGVDHAHFGRDRTDRPYMQGIIGTTDFKLSEAYISKNKKRPSLTAVQVIRNHKGRHVGYLGADFDTRELPHSENGYAEPDDWRQMKGDPAIRSGLFLQQRVNSIMDSRLDDVLPIMNELICEHGVFHGKLHFSSNRGTIWTLDDPYVYRILGIEELTDPDICLAYPGHPYPERAVIPAARVMQILNMFRTLRFADETVYLRAGSLNLINGMISLNFSCDGSHYMRYDEFLDKSTEFWFGTK